MSTYDLMKQAIQNKTSVACWYRDHYRILSPHTLGKKNGHYKVLSIQTGGDSSGGLRPTNEENWRCMFLEDIARPVAHDDPWETATNYSRTQTCVGEVHYEVAY